MLGCRVRPVNRPETSSAVSELFVRGNQRALWEGSFRGRFATTSGGAIFRRAKAGPRGGSGVALKELAKALGKTRGEGLEGVNWYRGHWELRDETRGCAVVRSRS